MVGKVREGSGFGGERGGSVSFRRGKGRVVSEKTQKK